MFLFTSETIQEAPELEEDLGVFQKIFSGQRMNLDKKDPLSYETLAKEMKLEPDEVLFIDDSLINLAAAGQAGMNLVHYQNNDQLFSSLNLLGLNP
jgi:HAD superfamily hydrolase (TIGR01509 family)